MKTSIALLSLLLAGCTTTWTQIEMDPLNYNVCQTLTEGHAYTGVVLARKRAVVQATPRGLMVLPAALVDAVAGSTMSVSPVEATQLIVRLDGCDGFQLEPRIVAVIQGPDEEHVDVGDDVFLIYNQNLRVAKFDAADRAYAKSGVLERYRGKR